jgi:hypothetical protein
VLLSLGDIVKSRVTLGFLGLTVAALYACGTKNGAAELCPPNQDVACNCPGTNIPGAQVCLEDGSGFDECVCDGVVSGTGTSASTSVGGTSTTASTGAGSTSSGFTTSSGGGPDKGVCDSGAACSVCQASACAINLCKNEKSGCDNSSSKLVSAAQIDARRNHAVRRTEAGSAWASMSARRAYATHTISPSDGSSQSSVAGGGSSSLLLAEAATPAAAAIPHTDLLIRSTSATYCVIGMSTSGTSE